MNSRTPAASAAASTPSIRPGIDGLTEVTLVIPEDAENQLKRALASINMLVELLSGFLPMYRRTPAEQVIEARGLAPLLDYIDADLQAVDEAAVFVRRIEADGHDYQAIVRSRPARSNKNTTARAGHVEDLSGIVLVVDESTCLHLERATAAVAQLAWLLSASSTPGGRSDEICPDHLASMLSCIHDDLRLVLANSRSQIVRPIAPAVLRIKLTAEVA